MTVVSDYREALAEFLSSLFDDCPVGPHRPPQPRGGTGYLQPGADRPWMDYRATGATFCKPAVATDLVLVAPQSLGQAPQAWEWLEQRIADLQNGLQGAGQLSTGQRAPRLMQVGSPGLLDAGGSALLAAVCELSPTHIGV